MYVYAYVYVSVWVCQCFCGKRVMSWVCVRWHYQLMTLEWCFWGRGLKWQWLCMYVCYFHCWAKKKPIYDKNPSNHSFIQFVHSSIRSLFIFHIMIVVFLTTKLSLELFSFEQWNSLFVCVFHWSSTHRHIFCVAFDGVELPTMIIKALYSLCGRDSKFKSLHLQKKKKIWDTDWFDIILV